MRSILIALALLLAATFSGQAQTLPNHVDPSARDVLPNLAAVPAIRFLTTPDYPPFNFRDESGELVGFNVDLARAICDELSIACTVQAWPWDQAGNALADRQGDALIAGLAITPETGERFDFSSIYLMLPGRFVVGRTAATEDFDPARLAGKRVGVRSNSAHAAFVARYLSSATAMPFDSETLALDALARNEVDAVFADALRASFWLNERADCCAFAGQPYFRPELFGEGLAVAIAPGQDAVRQAIDYALVRLKRSGVYDEIFLRWFPVDFY
jgi:polar amino acid transport system substrate-binding protein